MSNANVEDFPIVKHGTGSQMQMSDGTGASGNLAKYDAGGNTVDSGVAVSSLAASPLTTKGDLWGYDTGNARIPVGADGTVLTADSTQTKGVKWNTPASGALVLLEQHTASSSADLQFTSAITSSYDEYVVEMLNILPATNNVDCYLQFSTNGGSTWITSADYELGRTYTASSTNSSGGDSVQPKTGITLWFADFSNSNSLGMCGTFRMYSPLNASYYTCIIGHVYGPSSSGNFYSIVFSGRYKIAAATNAFRLIMSSGNVTSGIVRCYGLAK